MAVGNTFGATALSSYGGFWISFAIVLTPGGFDIVGAYATKDATGALTGAGVNDFNNALGYFLAGWFIFTFILLLCTLRSTVAFFLLFFFLDLAFLFLFLARLYATSEGAPDTSLNKAGGYFGLFAAIMAWYNALAGIADSRYVVLHRLCFFSFCEQALIHFLLQQLLLRNPRRTLPMVREGTREAICLQDRARDRLNTSPRYLIF
jgi:succinate-acetate transporter protein